VLVVAGALQGNGGGVSILPVLALSGGAHAAEAALGKVRREAPPLYASGTAPPKLRPMMLKDSERLFYFESDGQRVTALLSDGRILWSRNPVEETGLRGFLQDEMAQWPAIIAAGPPLDWMVNAMRNQGKSGDHIAITLNTKDFGVIDKQSGEFTLLGSD
jgi:hypothetical protein